MKGKAVLYILESYNLKTIVLSHIISLLVQVFFMKLYVAHVGLGCLFHIAKVPSASNCYIFNFFQEFLHCNTFHSYKPICHTFILVVWSSGSVKVSLLFLKLVLCILFSLCGLLVHQFQCKQYSITVFVLLLYKENHFKCLETQLN